MQSQIAVPVFDGERCCGVVSVESAGILDEGDRELLELFAQQIGVAITTARLHAALVHAAWTDPLTGVLNRAALLNGIEGALAEAAANGRTVTVLFVDLDHFKALNDRHGHQVGDTVLQRCAERMQALLPDGGLVGRYGGEEFVLLIADATGEAGVMLAEHLRAAIAATARAGERESVAVTVSIGIAQYPGDGEEMEALLRAADEALYRAKAAGRNRVRRAGDA